VSTTLSTEIAGHPKTSVHIYKTIRRYDRKHMTLCHVCCSFAADVATLSVWQTDRHVRVHTFTCTTTFQFWMDFSTYYI